MGPSLKQSLGWAIGVGGFLFLAYGFLPVFAGSDGHYMIGASCLSNQKELGTAMLIYLHDYDGRFPQVQRTSSQPEIEDRGRRIERPGGPTVFEALYPYFKSYHLLNCYGDPRFDRDAINASLLKRNSYVFNGSFVFGINENQIVDPSKAIMIAERRTTAVDHIPPYDDTIYRPWPDGAVSALDPRIGAIATTRHDGKSNYSFADSSAKSMSVSQTVGPGVNLHRIDRRDNHPAPR